MNSIHPQPYKPYIRQHLAAAPGLPAHRSASLVTDVRAPAEGFFDFDSTFTTKSLDPETPKPETPKSQNLEPPKPETPKSKNLEPHTYEQPALLQKPSLGLNAHASNLLCRDKTLSGLGFRVGSYHA